MPTADEYAAFPENGASVEQGAVIAIMENPDVFRRLDDLRRRVAELVLRTGEYDSYMRQNDLGPASDTLAEAIELQKVIRELVKLNTQRVIRAPIDGTLVAAKRIPQQPRSEVERMKLAPWHGTPLDRRNFGCSLEAGQEIVSIAPTARLHAVLYVDQTDREEVRRQPNVQIKLDHLPNITWVTEITSLSAKGEIVAPESLTTQFGGSLATKPGQSGQQQLASTVFRATAGLNFDHAESRADAVLMKPGMRGHARFIVSDRTVYDWAKLYFYETFRFRL
jgi:hypothetical protein